MKIVFRIEEEEEEGGKIYMSLVVVKH